MLAVTGSNYLISEAQIEASEARLDGQIESISSVGSRERNDLQTAFSELSSEIKSIVGSGLEARTDEVVMALSKLDGATENLTVRLANMRVESELFERFEQLAMEPGSDTYVYRIGDTAYGSIELDYLKGRPAREIQRLVQLAKDKDDASVEVQFVMQPDHLMRDNAYSQTLLEERIRALRTQLETMKN